MVAAALVSSASSVPCLGQSQGLAWPALSPFPGGPVAHPWPLSSRVSICCQAKCSILTRFTAKQMDASVRPRLWFNFYAGLPQYSPAQTYSWSLPCVWISAFPSLWRGWTRLHTGDSDIPGPACNLFGPHRNVTFFPLNLLPVFKLVALRPHHSVLSHTTSLLVYICPVGASVCAPPFAPRTPSSPPHPASYPISSVPSGSVFPR